MRELRRWQMLVELLHRDHWKQGDLAASLKVSVRTLQRDLDVIAGLLSIPGDHVSDHRGSGTPRDRDGKFYLEPHQQPFSRIDLTQHEARLLLFALRHLLHNSREHEKAMLELLEKLAGSFPGIIASTARLTIDQAKQLPKAPKQGVAQSQMIRMLTNAWMTQSLVRVLYQRPGSGARAERWCFQPVLLEPGATNGATYVLGCIPTEGTPLVRSLKLDRIRDVQPHGDVCPTGKQH